MEEPIVILVVEDDISIQGVIEEALSDGGFEPAIASTGEEAIAVLNGTNTTCRMLILDIKLGKDRIRGWDVARRARAINPAAPAQLVTAVAQLLNHSPLLLAAISSMIAWLIVLFLRTTLG